MRLMNMPMMAILVLAAGSAGAQGGPKVIWQHQSATDIPPLRTVEWSPDATYVASGGGTVNTASGNRGEITLWNAKNGAMVSRQNGFITSLQRLNDIVFHPSGAWIATAEGQGPASPWAINARSRLFSVPALDPGIVYPVQSSAMTRIAISPDGNLLARAQHRNPEVWIVDFFSGEIVDQWTAHQNGVTAVAFSPDGQYLATGGPGDNTVRVWRLSDQTLVLQLEPADTPYPWAVYGARSIAFSPEGELIGAINEGYEQPFRVWRLSDGQEIFRTAAIGQVVDARVLFTNDSSYAVFAERSNEPNAHWMGRIRFVSLKSLAVAHDWSISGSPNNGVMDAALSPDGSRIAYVEFDGRLTVAANPVAPPERARPGSRAVDSERALRIVLRCGLWPVPGFGAALSLQALALQRQVRDRAAPMRQNRTSAPEIGAAHLRNLAEFVSNLRVGR